MPRSDKVASLLDENQRLRARLKRCDEARREAERQIEELQRRVRRKESEWMAEYDKHVQALLEIIKHNEEEKEQLKESEERWRKAAEAVPPLVTKCTRSSQTETPLRAEKLSSVRFAEEERPTVDAKTKVKITRMQVLFEQLQASNDQHFSKSFSHASSNAEELRSGNGRRSVELVSNFKTTVLGRLQDQQTESNTVRQQHTTKSMGKTIETQTDNISPTQEAGERNRPLDERLATQQKVLDHLLCSKLQQANGPEENDLVPFTVSGTDIAANGHGKAQHKCEQTMKPVTSASSSLAIQIESVPATMDRGPLSPLAA